MTIGNNIKRIREEKGMTQKELADKCNIIYQTIGKYERNLLNPKYETLRKIAKALEVSSFDLIDGYKVPEPAEEQFVLTEYACMQLTLRDFNIDVPFEMAKAIEKRFMDLMMMHGHITKKGE